MSPPTAYLIFLSSIALLILLYSAVVYMRFSLFKKRMELSLREIDKNYNSLLELAAPVEKFSSEGSLQKQVPQDDEIYSKAAKFISCKSPGNTMKERRVFEKRFEEFFHCLKELNGAFPHTEKDGNLTKIKSQLQNCMESINRVKADYNKAARGSNKLLGAFPPFIIGQIFDFRRAELFDIKEP